MPSSDAKIAANRENAKLSTGPTTPAGKAIVARNAVKHGLCSHDPVAPGEEPADFQAHLASYLQTYSPIGAAESDCVLQLASSSWRLRRVFGIEAGMLTLKINGSGASFFRENRPDLKKEGRHGWAFINQAREFELLSRHETRLHRVFQTTLGVLYRLQEERAKQTQTPTQPDESVTLDSAGPVVETTAVLSPAVAHPPAGPQFDLSTPDLLPADPSNPPPRRGPGDLDAP